MKISTLLFRLYRIHYLRKLVIKTATAMEGGELLSPTLRQIFKGFYQVDIGLYSYGGCFEPGTFDKHTTVGRYCSVARGVRVFNRNHPMEFKSTHPYFFNSAFGYCENDLVPYQPLHIKNDVWIGHGAIIVPKVRIIGDGAVIGAGTVVDKDVPPFAVVVGNPMKIVRYRFPDRIIEEILSSRWWEKPIDEIKPYLDGFKRPFVRSG